MIENLHIDPWGVKNKDGKSVPQQTKQSHQWHQHSLIFLFLWILQFRVTSDINNIQNFQFFGIFLDICCDHLLVGLAHY